MYKMSCKRLYRKIDGKYEYDEPDVHNRHRRKLKSSNTRLLRRRIGGWLGMEHDINTEDDDK